MKIGIGTLTLIGAMALIGCEAGENRAAFSAEQNISAPEPTPSTAQSAPSESTQMQIMQIGQNKECDKLLNEIRVIAERDGVKTGESRNGHEIFNIQSEEIVQLNDEMSRLGCFARKP